MSKVVLFVSVSLDGFFEGPRKEIDWHMVSDEFPAHVDEVLALALADHLTAIDWTEADELALTLKGATSPDGGEVAVRH